MVSKNVSEVAHVIETEISLSIMEQETSTEQLIAVGCQDIVPFQRIWK